LVRGEVKVWESPVDFLKLVAIVGLLPAVRLSFRGIPGLF